MASSNASTTFGASIDPPRHENNASVLLQPMGSSPAMTPAPSHDSLHDGYATGKVPPTSPFYQHPPASHEVIPPSKHLKVQTHVYEKDLESGNDAPLTPASTEEHPFSSKIAVEHNKECTMWPSRQTLMQKYQARKQQKRQAKGIKGCAPLREQWGKLGKRNQLLVKIGIALFFIGVAVAIGVGISVAVKGSYYAGDGKSNVIGHP